MKPEQIDGSLAAAVASVPQVVAIHFIDAHGIVRYTSDNTVPVGKDLSQQSFFVARQGSAGDDLFLTQPLVTQWGRSVVIASRKILDAHGDSPVS